MDQRETSKIDAGFCLPFSSDFNLVFQQTMHTHSYTAYSHFSSFCLVCLKLTWSVSQIFHGTQSQLKRKENTETRSNSMENRLFLKRTKNISMELDFYMEKIKADRFLLPYSKLQSFFPETKKHTCCFHKCHFGFMDPPRLYYETKQTWMKIITICFIIFRS